MATRMPIAVCDYERMIDAEEEVSGPSTKLYDYFVANGDYIVSFYIKEHEMEAFMFTMNYELGENHDGLLLAVGKELRKGEIYYSGSWVVDEDAED